jgi:hypothetical protein
MFLGLEPKAWMVIGGVVLLAASVLIVNRFDLARRGPFVAIMGNEGKRLPGIAAMVLGLAGGALLFLGMRG